MDSRSSHAGFANTQAITIPAYTGTSSSRHAGSQHPYRRADQRQRLSDSMRADSDAGNASSSSLGSDWTSSPVSPTQSANQPRFGVQVSVASPPSVSPTMHGSSTPFQSRQRKDKQRASASDLPPNTLPPLFAPSQSPLGPSMVSTSAYKSVNLNSHYDPECKEPARLITYTKYAQGFTWNDELFLPSYMLGKHRYRHGGGGARRRWGGDEEDDGLADFEEDGERCPVTDIFVTDEEAAAMMP